MDRQQAVNASMFRRIYVISVVQEKKYQNINPGKLGTVIKIRDLIFVNAFWRVRELL